MGWYWSESNHIFASYVCRSERCPRTLISIFQNINGFAIKFKNVLHNEITKLLPLKVLKNPQNSSFHDSAKFWLFKTLIVSSFSHNASLTQNMSTVLCKLTLLCTCKWRIFNWVAYSFKLLLTLLENGSLQTAFDNSILYFQKDFRHFIYF